MGDRPLNYVIPREKPVDRPQAPSDGVKAMSIEGRFQRERERLTENFTDADRQWRKQWFKDQELAPDEPRDVPELRHELMNPIRRLYRYPFDMVEKGLTPIVGNYVASGVRYWVPKFLMTCLTIMAIRYYGKYNMNDWTRDGGWRLMETEDALFPGDPGFPKVPARKNPNDYSDRGFKARKALLPK